jgi:protein TonB
MKAAVSPRLLLAVAASLLVNLLLFELASLLASERGAPEDLIDPVGIKLVSLAAPEPPKQEEIKEPEKPKEEPKSDFTPDLVRPQLSGMAGIDAAVAINLGNIGGDDMEKEFVFEAYELDQAPQAVVRIPPVYPYRARERGIEGVVQVKLLVNTDGTVGQVEILDARPEGMFEDAVRNAVPKWKFNPGKIQGKAVTAWVVTFVRFGFD